MAKVFGVQTTGEPPAAKAEHFVASKCSGSKTACGRVFRPERAMRGWKEWRMVTCQQCRARMPEGAK